ncbi:helix-turn-helix domain-containing protein [Streptomyces katrae]|uniref:Helix-turn-helix domain-containing protein n=1 Tax=Streptomyces katrae TaxID=68223 RepID=A0ABT7H605_9ACTN|nr:transcriptional regulator [Streptomyces katrae]MDK9501340.1 helix-turn-helix domain-containing protein [Streptomyces katrae]
MGRGSGVAEPETEEFARLMRELKERGGLSYGVLARRLHTSTSTLHRYCAGEAVPAEFAVVDRFARACGAAREEALALHRAWLLADARRRSPGRGPSGTGAVAVPAAEPGAAAPDAKSGSAARSGEGAVAAGAGAGEGTVARDGAEPGAGAGAGGGGGAGAGAGGGASAGTGAAGGDPGCGAASGAGTGSGSGAGSGVGAGDGAGAAGVGDAARSGAGSGSGVPAGPGTGAGAAARGRGVAWYRRRAAGVGVVGVVAAAVAAAVLAAAGPGPRAPETGPVAGAGAGAGPAVRPSDPAATASPGAPTGSASATPPEATRTAPSPSGSRGTGPGTAVAPTTPPAGPAGAPLTAAVRSHVWAAGCDHAYLSERAPESVPAPPVEADAPAWARAQRAVHAGTQTVEVSLHGTGEQAVVLQGLEVRVTGRRTPPAWNVYQMSPGCGGGLTPAGFAVNLDAPRPLARPVPGNDSGTRLPAPAFPLRVSATDPAVLRVTASATGCDCDWYLELRWSGPGGSGTLRLDDDGVPWRTSAATGRPEYGFAGELGRWSR